MAQLAIALDDEQNEGAEEAAPGGLERATPRGPVPGYDRGEALLWEEYLSR